jgi:glycosyl transferase family 25
MQSRPADPPVSREAEAGVQPRRDAAAAGVKTRIVVVSVSGAADRRARFTARAQGAKVAWEFVDAYTSLHPGLRYDEDAAIVFKGRPLKKGELGCYSSHFAAWESLLASDCDQYIVLEDDVIVDWPFVEEIARRGIASFGFPYLRLMFKRPAHERIIRNEFLDKAHRIVDLMETGLGTQGYVITKSAAQALRDHCRVVRRPIDDEMDRSWEHGVRNISVFPFPLIEEFGVSSIGDARFDRPTKPENPRLRLRRAIWRRREYFRRSMLLRIRWLKFRFMKSRMMG